MQKPECAATESRRVGLDYAERRADGDGRVECVTAGVQNLLTGRSCERMRASDGRLAGNVRSVRDDADQRRDDGVEH